MKKGLFFLYDDVYPIQTYFFHFYFLNIDPSVTMDDFELKFSVCNPNIPFKRILGKNPDMWS